MGCRTGRPRAPPSVGCPADAPRGDHTEGRTTTPRGGATPSGDDHTERRRPHRAAVTTRPHVGARGAAACRSRPRRSERDDPAQRAQRGIQPAGEDPRRVHQLAADALRGQRLQQPLVERSAAAGCCEGRCDTRPDRPPGRPRSRRSMASSLAAPGAPVREPADVVQAAGHLGHVPAAGSGRPRRATSMEMSSSRSMTARPRGELQHLAHVQVAMDVLDGRAGHADEATDPARAAGAARSRRAPTALAGSSREGCVQGSQRVRHPAVRWSPGPHARRVSG